MGLFWDLYQQSQISRHEQVTGDLEARVGGLERRVAEMQELLGRLVLLLEQQLGQDIDRDGQVGA